MKQSSILERTVGANTGTETHAAATNSVRKTRLMTAEAVRAGHPDKFCDQLAVPDDDEHRRYRERQQHSGPAPRKQEQRRHEDGGLKQHEQKSGGRALGIARGDTISDRVGELEAVRDSVADAENQHGGGQSPKAHAPGVRRALSFSLSHRALR